MTERAKKLLLLYYKQSRKIRRVSGLPPLTFKAKKAGTLKNYRIYGNTETLTRSYSGAASLSFPIVDGAVRNYRIYGNTENGESVGDKTANILPLSRTPITETHGDFLCEYDGLGTITLTTDKDNATTDDEFVIPLIQDFTIPVSIGQGGTGCFQINNDTSLSSGSNSIKFYYNDTYYVDGLSFFGVNRTESNYKSMGNRIINSVSVVINNGASSRKITIKPAFVENVTEQVPFEPYGYRVPITNNSETANIYLDEPLKKSGDNADYIDYAKQKRYNADETSADVTLPALPAQSSTNSLSVDTTVQPSSVAVDVAEVVSCGDKITDNQSVNYGKYKIPVTLTAGSAETTDIYLDEPLKKGRIYGFHIDPSVSDSSNAVTYIADAVGKTPAAMGANTFSFGDWENAFFMPKPCMLKSDGTVDYYLDPNDYTKKADGTPSDVANANYDGNAMMEWGKIWYKFVPTETDGEVYFYVADYKADNDYHCWCNIDSQNNETDHFYTAIYNGTGTEKLRSISGVILTSANGNGDTTVTEEVTRATANNTTNNVEWYTEVYSDRMLINMLLVLMGKSLNSQAVYGRGLDTGGQTAKEAYVTGTLNDKGLFWGDTSAGTSGIKVFGMENYWGCVWHRTAGLISINNHAYAKLTYSTADGSSVTGYNQTGNSYLEFGSAPNTNGWIKTMKYNRKGLIPFIIDGAEGNSNHYYGDYYYQNANTRYLLLGCRSGLGLNAGAMCFSLNATPDNAVWNCSTTLSCKPISKGSKPHTPDYIDYATQKRHNSDGTESSVTLPEISTLAGTNTLTVGTEVQPSYVEISGRIKAAGGD